MYTKEDFSKIAEAEKLHVPLFYKPWWLTAVAGDDWDIRITENKGSVSGIMAFCTKKQFVFDKIFVPQLTPYSGPFLFYPDGLNEYEKRSFEKKTIADLLAQIPAMDDVRMKIHWQQDNALPYLWHGFSQTSHYTYVLEEIKNHDKLYDNLKDSLKRQIHKAEKLVTIEETTSYEAIAALFQKSLNKKEAGLEIPDSMLKRIDEEISSHNAGKKWIAKNQKGETIAGIYVVWDEQTAYYLYGGFEESEAQTGAMSLLFWKAILEVSSFTERFDFEGSRIEGVERFFRSFGGKLKPCHFFWKTTSPLLKRLNQLK